MDVLMAIGTFQTEIPEVPFLLFLVAGEAGCGKMGALKGEFPAVMLFDGER